MSFTETIKGEFPLYIFKQFKFITTASVKNQCRTQNLQSLSNFSLKILPNFLFPSHPFKRQSSILLFFRDSLFLGGVSLIFSFTPYFCDILQCNPPPNQL